MEIRLTGKQNAIAKKVIDLFQKENVSPIEGREILLSIQNAMIIIDQKELEERKGEGACENGTKQK